MIVLIEDDRTTKLDDMVRLDRDLRTCVEEAKPVRISANGNEYLITPVREVVD